MDTARTLDPALLDDIVAGMDLQDLALLERAMLHMRRVFADLEAWLRRLADDDDSWLNRLADLVGAAGDAANSWTALDVLFVALPVIFVAIVLCAGTIFLWRQRGTREHPVPDYPIIAGAGVAREHLPLTSLPTRDQPGAMFHRVCVTLARGGALMLRKNATNTAIARQATLPDGAHDPLMQLAHAADRALFGGWVPTEPELVALRRVCEQITIPAPTA